MTAIKAAHRTKRQADGLGTVAFVLLWHGNTRDVGFNGVNGRSGANGRNGCIKLIDGVLVRLSAVFFRGRIRQSVWWFATYGSQADLFL